MNVWDWVLIGCTVLTVVSILTQIGKPSKTVTLKNALFQVAINVAFTVIYIMHPAHSLF
jgi:hypothetical protein